MAPRRERGGANGAGGLQQVQYYAQPQYYQGRGQRRDYGYQDGDARTFQRQNSRGRGRGRRGRGRDNRRGGYSDYGEIKRASVVNPEPPDVVTSDVTAALAGLVPGAKSPPTRSPSASRLQTPQRSKDQHMHMKDGFFDSMEMHRPTLSPRIHKHVPKQLQQWSPLDYQNVPNAAGIYQQQQLQTTANPGMGVQFTNEPHIFVPQEGSLGKQEEEREYVKDKDSAANIDSSPTGDGRDSGQTTELLADSSADEEQVEYDDEVQNQVKDPIVKLWLQHVNDDNQQVGNTKDTQQNSAEVAPMSDVCCESNSLVHLQQQDNLAQVYSEPQKCINTDNDDDDDLHSTQGCPQCIDASNIAPHAQESQKNEQARTSEQKLTVASTLPAIPVTFEHPQKQADLQIDQCQQSGDNLLKSTYQQETRQSPQSQQIIQQEQQRKTEISTEVANVEELAEQAQPEQRNQEQKPSVHESVEQHSTGISNDLKYSATPRIDELREDVPEINVKLLKQKFDKDKGYGMKSPAVKKQVPTLRSNQSFGRRGSYTSKDVSKELRPTQSFAHPTAFQSYSSRSLSSHVRNRSHDDESDTTSQMSTESSRILRLRQGWEEGAPIKDDEDEGESKPSDSTSSKSNISSLLEKFKQQGAQKASSKDNGDESTKGVKQMAMKMFQSNSLSKTTRKSSIKADSKIGQMMARFQNDSK
eukprot:TRINITY_DN970_c0_g1_i5.p1 TRINITY_DN970_c0_g1~~TRINITY_DN970_c0_g1_i5.p1  ORF type:complete len:697 (-),score=71.74 TRINITY_DN970_c0_g1_i5:669-2759(-)